MPRVHTVVFGLLGFLLVLIVFFALTNEPPYQTSLPVETTQQAGVAERALTLSNGRTITCLLFSSPPAVSCDWSRSAN
jgi:hypothetical protein